MADKFKLEIITPEKIIYAEEIDQVSLPTTTGEITILPHHIPLISSLGVGEVKIVKNNQSSYIAIAGGIIQVNPNHVSVLTHTAEKAEEIDLAKVEEAHQRATELLKEKNKDDVDYSKLLSQIEKDLIKMKVARRRRHHAAPIQVPDSINNNE